MSTRTHPSSQCKKLALTQPLSQKRWRNKSHIVMGIESETSLELLLLIFARRKIQRTVITEVHLIHPNFTSLETWISIFMRRKRLVSLIYDDCFIHHLQQQPIFLLVWLIIQINIFINLKLFEFWRNCSVPFFRINFDDWMVHINSTSLQTRRWKSFTFSHWWQKFSPCQQSGELCFH